MDRNEPYLKKLFCKDAENIVIDEEFKSDLKSRIMFGDKYNTITERHKRKNKFKQSKYLKIASGFAICVVVSATIFKTADAPSEKIVAKVEANPEFIMSLGSTKKLFKENSGKTNVLQPKKEVVKINKENKVPNISKHSEDIHNDNPLEEYSKKSSTLIAENTENVESTENDIDINNSTFKDDENTSILTNENDQTNVPKMDDVKEDTSEISKCYDSRYSVDQKNLVSVKDGGIYIKDVETSKEKKLISYNEETHIVDKPNLTPDDEIIYYKAQKDVSGEKNGAIYLSDKNGEESTKIVDGKSPVISKDGRKLVYEAEGKIYVLNLETNDKRLVDSGKYPDFSDNGNLISYVKEEKETQSYDLNTEEKEVYIEKSFSSLWVFDLVTENTRSLTDNKININNNSIQSWVEDVTSGKPTGNFDVASEYSYFESIWSSDNKEIYVIRKNNDSQTFELIKFKLD